MYDDEAISVSISASKELEGDAAYSNAEGACASSSSAAASKRQKFTMYTVIVRNRLTGSKVIVKHRYSDFYRLRKELIEFVSWGHCRACDSFLAVISEYPFPRRRLLRSSQPGVVKERMDSLALFLRHLLQCIQFKRFEDCEHAKSNVEACVLRQFLQIEYEELFPKMSAKAHVLHAMEERRQQQQVLVAGLRAQTAAHSAVGERHELSKKSSRPPVVDADTCRRCLQKWTHCYCNDDDDDGFYPQHDDARGRDSDASDSSRCSRCHHEWGQCFCCQQVSPTVSSACTEY
ncbi:hypothetical protein ATCC90586_008341 [Pythium insidiosum]|nr:hypothetical protein ATCC90586_008341 [Pythium insidiosum]